ncbi:MAG: FkbM family methyltransferase [Nitrosomonas sp.]
MQASNVKGTKMNRVRNILRNTYAAVPFKKPLFQLLRICIRLPAWLYQHLHFVAPISIPIQGGNRFKMYHFGAQVENDLFWAGYGNGWEATSLRLWARLAAVSNTVFDIGANTGVYALAAKAVNERAKVFAFEPVTSIASRLEHNIELNGFDITVVQAGASSSTGEAVMYIPSTDHSYSASLNANMLSGHGNLVETIVQTLRVDEFVKDNNLTSADLFKIDTEQHEVDVLSGFGGVIERFKPAVLIEILDQDLGKEVEAFFAGFDYVFYEIIEGKEVRRVESLGASSRNYLLCSKDFATLNGFGDVIQHNAL